MKKKIILIIATFLLIVSIGFALYPTVSEIINKKIAENTINQYNNLIDSMDTVEIKKYITQAEKYNKNLSNIISDSFSPDAYNVDPSYEEIMDFADDGQIGIVEIPKINCKLPIYHGINESYLDKGAVHMCNTSFPIGGKSTHAVISAHTAYPGKIFFDKLDKLENGDVFYITVLNRKMTYTVSDINTVLPTDTNLLKIVNGQDLVTLVTCTPYSVNTHRLLVTGKRNIEKEKIINDEKRDDKIGPYFYFILVAFVIIPTLIIIFIPKRRRKKNDQED